MIKCPSCDSENVQAFELIYKAGTSNIRATTVGGGMAGDGMGIGAAGTSGTFQTYLAEDVAPPRRKSYFGEIVLSVFLTILLFGFVVNIVPPLRKIADHHSDILHVISVYSDPTEAKKDGGGFLLLLLGTGIQIVIGYTLLRHAARHNKVIFPKEYQKWKASFLCLRCGKKFLVRP